MENQNIDTKKLTDKAFSRLLLISVLSILVCIVCLCSATWAWFSAGTSSAGNTISSGKFALDVEIEDSTSVAVDLTESANGTYTCTLGDADTTYTVTVRISADSTATKGFCTVKVGDESYYTVSINETMSSLTFYIQPTEANMTVTFVSVWGFPSATDLIEADETLTTDN